MTQPGIDWTLESLREHLSAIINERDRAYQQRWEAQEEAVSAALSAAEKAVSAALISQEKAVANAFNAQEKAVSSALFAAERAASVRNSYSIFLLGLLSLIMGVITLLVRKG